MQCVVGCGLLRADVNKRLLFEQWNTSTMKNLHRLLFIFILSFPLFAGAEAKMKLEVDTDEGTSEINIFKYINNWGKHEIRIEAAGLPRLGNINPLIGFGRDLDDDGNIETFFLIDSEKGLVTKKFKNEDKWGISLLRNSIFHNYDLSTKAHIAAAYGTVFGTVLMGVSHWAKTERDLWLELVNLEEFTQRTKAAYQSGQMNQAQWIESLNIILQANEEIHNRYEKAMNEERAILASLDVTLWLAGGVIGKWLNKGFGFIAKPLTKSAFYKSTSTSVKKMFSSVVEKTKAKAGLLRVTTGVSASRVSQSLFKTKFETIFKAVVLKNTMLKKSIPVVNKITSSLGAGLLEWKYIALLTGIQVGTETAVNWADVQDPDAVQVAKNVLSNEDIMTNLGYQLANSYLFTAAGHTIKSKRMNFVACGFVAATNSAVTNLVIRDSKDYKRIAFDTAYSMVVDTAQVMIDLKALSYFEAMATKNKNPKLKLIGYAIVVVDTAIGLTGYALLSKQLEEDETPAPTVQLVPVMVESEDQKQAS